MKDKDKQIQVNALLQLTHPLVLLAILIPCLSFSIFGLYRCIFLGICVCVCVCVCVCWGVGGWLGGLSTPHYLFKNYFTFTFRETAMCLNGLAMGNITQLQLHPQYQFPFTFSCIFTEVTKLKKKKKKDL